MTDRSQGLTPEDLSAEDRIKRLQERPTAASATPRVGRRHPAARSRALFAGLALASFGVVGASMAATQSISTSTVAAPAPAPVVQTAVPAVTASPAPSSKATTPAPTGTRSAPVTRTRGS